MNSQNGVSGGLITVFVILGLIYLAVLVLTFWAYVRIIQRAGYSGWWVLISFVPIANIVMLLVFGFKEWPVQRELNALRAQVYGRGGGPQWYGGQPGG